MIWGGGQYAGIVRKIAWPEPRKLIDAHPWDKTKEQLDEMSEEDEQRQGKSTQRHAGPTGENTIPGSNTPPVPCAHAFAALNHLLRHHSVHVHAPHSLVPPSFRMSSRKRWLGLDRLLSIQKVRMKWARWKSFWSAKAMKQ